MYVSEHKAKYEEKKSHTLWTKSGLSFFPNLTSTILIFRDLEMDFYAVDCQQYQNVQNSAVSKQWEKEPESGELSVSETALNDRNKSSVYI